MTAPAGALTKEFASAKKGLRKSASLEKRSNRHAGELTVSLGGHALPLAVVSSGIVPSAQANDSATTATKKSHKGFKGIFSRLNKMRGKKEGKSLDDVVPSGETKARRNSTLKRRPTHSGGLTASLGRSLGAQPIEPPFHSSKSRSGSMSAGSGATQYSTLVSKIFSILHCWQDLHYEVRLHPTPSRMFMCVCVCVCVCVCGCVCGCLYCFVGWTCFENVTPEIKYPVEEYRLSMGGACLMEFLCNFRRISREMRN